MTGPVDDAVFRALRHEIGQQFLPHRVLVAGNGSEDLPLMEGRDTAKPVWGPDNKLYVLQHATGPGLTGPGALIRVRADGTKEMIASAGLTKPTSFVIADDEDESGMTFYVSNCGSCPGLAGHVVKIKE